ncbi:polysaccharide pyruvyl transferase family protein [Thioalkalicoccus limnaeus]|uniref:Polysaccharide pyruvyl transferase family protein n=1 Tax=Thioalkalicoccus limnaeus TaxID=120681 RepID=A0ABV4BC46_9GAMM
MARSYPPTIALFGIFGADNFGNDGSLVAMLNHLRATCEGVRVSAICTYPHIVEARHGVPAIPIREALEYRRSSSFAMRLLHRVFVRLPWDVRAWVRCVLYMREVNLLVIPGTGILDDYAVSPGDLPYGLFRWCVAARLAGAKVLFVSVGAGPITHPTSRWLMRAAARLADYRSFRDQISKDFMTSLGLDTRRDRVYPDLTFSLPPPTPRLHVGVSREPSVIGVGVMAFYGWANDPVRGEVTFSLYVNKIADFVVWLLGCGYSVRLILGERGDAVAADFIIRRAKSLVGCIEGKLIWSAQTSVEAVLAEISLSDMLVATRFHNLVWGVLLDKPMISLGYLPRHAALMRDVGLEKYCQQIEDFELRILIEHFNEVRDDWCRLENRVRQKRLEYQWWLQQQYDGPLSRFFCGA